MNQIIAGKKSKLSCFKSLTNESEVLITRRLAPEESCFTPRPKGEREGNSGERRKP